MPLLPVVTVVRRGVFFWLDGLLFVWCYGAGRAFVWLALRYYGNRRAAFFVWQGRFLRIFKTEPKKGSAPKCAAALFCGKDKFLPAAGVFAHLLASVRRGMYNRGEKTFVFPFVCGGAHGSANGARSKRRKKRMVGSFNELVGKTPLLRLAGVERACGAGAQILGKLESYNPTGSVKDRVALAMVEDMERRGVLKAGGTVIEPTSGNTGIGLAAVCAVKGYTLILTMPETMSEERRKLIAAYGAKIVLTPGAAGMRGAIEEAERIRQNTPGSVIAGQFENPANPAAHYASTAPELWADAEGRLDVFVAGVGTGGTFTGCARYLKEKNPALRAVAVEPQGSPVLSGGKAGAHGLQGIGAGFVPKVLDTSLIDEVIPVADADAFAVCRLLAQKDGVFAGITAGAAVWAAVRLALRTEYEGKRIAVILPDTGARYLSGEVFSAQ